MLGKTDSDENTKPVSKEQTQRIRMGHGSYEKMRMDKGYMVSDGPHVHAWFHVRVDICVARVCKWRPEVDISCLPQGLSRNLEISGWARLLSRQALGILSPLPSAGLISVPWRSELSSSLLHTQPFTNSPALLWNGHQPG